MRAKFEGSCLRVKGWIAVVLTALVAVTLLDVRADARPSSGKTEDPAVAFMEKAARDLLAGARTQSPILLSNAVKRYGDVHYIGQYSLGTYRAKLAQADRPIYLNGMVRFIGRYAASQVPKYPVVKYEILSPSVQGGSGIMVDSRIIMRDGSAYEVRWLLSKVGNTYRVRDAMVYGFWVTPFLKQLFETYIGEQGGDVKALVVVLNR